MPVCSLLVFLAGLRGEGRKEVTGSRKVAGTGRELKGSKVRLKDELVLQNHS